MRKKLLFLGCNYSQIPYLKAINKRKWLIIGVDLNKNSPGKAFCEKFYNVGYDNLKGLIKVGLNEKFSNNDMVFTAASQFAHKGAAHFSEYFNIKYPQEKTIDLCLNKIKFYDYFLKNNVPIPNTCNIKNKNELKSEILNSKCETFYLKSDFSKNPSYVYKFYKSKIPWDNFFWGKDRYLREHYVLQEEVKGTSLRINIFGNRYNVFDFQSGLKTKIYNDKIVDLGIFTILKNFLKNLKIENWLVKFDIILHKDKYVVLDIGLDPPMRMLKYSKENNIKFEKLYIEHYLYGKINYPKKLD